MGDILVELINSNCKLIISNYEPEKGICFQFKGDKYWINTDSVYKSVKRTIINNVEYYRLICGNNDADEYHYENGMWRSNMYSKFEGEVNTLSNCRNAMIYLEILRYIIILNQLIDNLDFDIIRLIKIKCCHGVNLRLLTDITMKKMVNII